MTWIFFKGIPPEWYGINKARWEKEQQQVLWIQRELRKEYLEEAIKHGAKVIKEKKDTVIIEEPSVKADTAGKLFEEIPSRDKIDSLLLLEFLTALNLTEKDIKAPTTSFYSPLQENRITSHFIVKKDGKKEIKTETRIIKSGSGQLIFVTGLARQIDGILCISYQRTDDGNFQFEKMILTYRAEKEGWKVRNPFPAQLKINQNLFLMRNEKKSLEM